MAVKEPLQIAIISTTFKLPGILDAVDVADTIYQQKINYSSLSDDFWSKRCGYTCNTPSFAGIISDIDHFPAEYFGIVPREVPTIDPQQRLVLLGIRDLLESASFHHKYSDISDVGVFIGASGSEYRQRFINEPVNQSLYATTGTANSVIAGRVSYHFNLSGPSLIVDTACSSSLVSVALAVNALKSKSCQFAIAGGVNLLISARTNDEYSMMGMTSNSGRNATFADSADGYVRSEGYGFVLLRPLSDALRDRDTILGVISSAVINQDGTTNGITAPSGVAQISLMKSSLNQANLSPSDISYHECHGTATRLGDLIELRSLASIYDSECRLPIGSFKANIGHLEVAAGIAGLIKSIIMLRTGKIPPSPFSAIPNKTFNWDSGHGLFLPSSVELLSLDSQGRSHIGISSFGFSGTNCHVIISDHKTSPVDLDNTAINGIPGISLVSSPNKNLLDCHVARVYNYLNTFSTNNHAISHSTLTTRERFDSRSFIDLVVPSKLSDYSIMNANINNLKPLQDSLVFIFDGQGCYHDKLGKTIYTQSYRTRCALDHCIQILKELQYPHADLISQHFISSSLKSNLHLPPAAQQIVIAISQYAIAFELLTTGIKPSLVIGHSLGEYIAAVVSGKITIEFCLAVLTRRSLLIQEVGQLGTLIAVNISPEQATCSPLNLISRLSVVNSDSSVVLGCLSKNYQSLTSELSKSARFRDLDLTVPYHTGFISTISDQLKAFSYPESISNPNCRLISCITADFFDKSMDIEYWALQLQSTVLFSDAVRLALAQSPKCFIEISPRPILSRHINKLISSYPVPLLTTDEQSDNDNSTFATRILSQLLPIGLLDPNYFLTSSSNLPIDPLLPVTGLGGEVYWYQPSDTRNPIAAQSHAISAITRKSKISNSSAHINISNDQQITKELVHLFGQICSINADKIDVAKPFQRFGADSLLLSQFATQLSAKIGTTVTVAQLFGEYNTIEKIIDWIRSTTYPCPPEQLERSELPYEKPVFQDYVINQPVSTKTTLPSSSTSFKQGVILPNSPESSAYNNYLLALSRSLSKKLSTSKQIRSTSSFYLADSRAIAGYDPDFKEFQFPVVGESGFGASFIDADGNKFVDLTMGFGVQLFGHHPDFIDKAIRNQLTKGVHLGPQSKLASKVTCLISEVTGKERITFCNSGTEAIMTALRIARAKSRKKIVAQFIGAYHGHFDPTLCIKDASGESLPLSPGIPLDYVSNTLLLDYGNADETLARLCQFKNQLAAVLVEPIQSRNPSLQPLSLLKQIEIFCKSNDILLIFDEVLTGFRVSQSGVQGLFNLKPHLTCYGKIVGGGLPIGVVAGDSDLMDYVDKGSWIPGQSVPNDSITNIFFAGTFNKNPLVMATAEAVLLHLRSANGEIQRSLNEYTDQFIVRLNTALSSISREVRVDHFSSFFRFVGFPPIFYYALLDKGLYVWEGRTCFLSTSHTQADLQLIHDVVLATTQELVDIGALTSYDANKSLTPNTISHSPQTSTYRLTSSQVEMLTSHLIDPNAASKYNQSLLIKISSSVDITRLLLAISNTIKLHTELYTSYDLDTKLATLHSPFNLQLSISTSIEESVKSSFSPLDGVNVKIFLISGASNDSSSLKILLVFPHFSVDGWSLQLIANGFCKSYDLLGTDATISNLTIFDNTYCNYSKYVFSIIAEPSSHAYWSKQLANCTTTISFLGNSEPVHDHSKLNLSYSASHEALEVNLDNLSDVASSLGVSQYIFLLSIFVILICDLTAHEDFVVATICAGQLTSGMRSLVGNCTSILPLRFFRNDLVADLFNSVDKIFAESLSHSHYDLRSLLDSLSIKPNKCGHALSNVCFNYDSFQPSDSSLASNIEYNPYFLHESKWDLFLNIVISPKSILLSLEANIGHMSKSLAESILPAYVELLTGYISNPFILHSSRFSLISTPDNDSAGQIFTSSRNLVSEKVTKLFENNWLLSRLNSYDCLNDRIALRTCNRTLTYSDLLNEIKFLADKVLDYCGDNNLIAIATTDSMDSILLMLTCWASGNAPLHLSTNDPISWALSRIRQAECHLVISNELSLAAAGSNHISLSPHLFLIELPPHYKGLKYVEPTYLFDAAYLLCTSGTTGEPKIPVIPHGAIERYTHNISACFELSGHDQDRYIFGLLTPLSSDLGYTMIFPALYYGHTIRCFSYSEARDGILLSKALQNDPIDFLKIVPSHLSALFDSGLSFDNLPKHSIVFGGDFLSPRLVIDILQRIKDIKVYNHYGPSETTVGVCCTRLTLEDLNLVHSYIPVGKPFSGTGIRISPLPDDYSSSDLFPDIKSPKGEVVISGSSLMLGYSDQLLNSGLSKDGIPTDYCSGDIGFIDKADRLVILGRMSQLIKIKGYRVSIPFIESQIAELSLFSESVVIPFSSAQSSDVELVCLACSVDPDSVNIARAELFSRIPSYYRPKHFFIVETIPKLSNGKPDRRSCAEIVNNLVLTSDFTSNSPQAIPVQSSQYANTAEWPRYQLLLSQVLRLDNNISLSSSFIELGGDSIDAIRFASLLRKSGFTLSPVQILESTSLHTLFDLLSHNSNKSELTIASTQLQSNGELFLTPAQTLACSLNPANIENWGLCCLVRIPDIVSNDEIANRIKSIVVGSASLQYSLIDGRLRLTRKASSHSYRSSVVRQLDFNSYQSESEFLVPTSIATDLTSQLSISDSRYIAWTKISGPKNDLNTYIVLCVHHFFFDVISLQSLVSCLYPLDGELGLVGNTYVFENAMASIYASVPIASHELGLYLDSLRQPPPLPFNIPSALPASSFSSVSLILPKYNLAECFRSPRFGNLPAFLYCLCKSLSKLTGLCELLIDIETHGRPVDESCFNTLDIFSFFTCHTPIVLETMKNNQSILDILRDYERELSCISKIAIPYNTLALRESSLGHQQVIFSVNYVSIAPSMLSNGPEILSYNTGVLSSESFLRSYPFQFVVLENASELIIRFDFDLEQLDAIGVSLQLLNEHIQELWNTDLCEAQSSAQAMHHTPDSCLTDHDDSDEDILGRLFS